MPPKEKSDKPSARRGRPAKAVVLEPEPEVHVSSVSVDEVPPPTESEEIKEIAVHTSAPVPMMYDEEPVRVAETPLSWRQRVVHEILEEEYRTLIRDQIHSGTLELERPEDREMLQEIVELRSRTPAPPPAPAPAPIPVKVDVCYPEPTPAVPPLATPAEWAEEFGVLLSGFFQTEKGITLADALERQTKVWLRVAQQLERLTQVVSALLDEPLTEDLESASLQSGRK